MNEKAILVVMLFILIDWLSGFLIAVITGRFCSAKMRKGLLNKIGEIMAVLLCYAVEAAFAMFDVTLPAAVSNIDSVVAVYIVVMEIGSVIENILKMNPELGAKLKTIFKEVHDYDGRD